jgi:phosphohistidine phosphatase
MHRLHLLRHAKSVEDDAADDHARRLSRRGRDDARRIGQSFAAELGALDLVLCSTALRTRETASLVLGGFSPPPRVSFEEGLYLAGRAKLVRRLCDLGEGDGAVLVIGHNPGLHELALALAAEDSEAYRLLAAGKFPTLARASFAIATSWSNLTERRHRLTGYATPKSLAE